tara:strand:- start:78 stop:392 length:315 start_codon:yes stop_codon:yes gene_type:complete
MTKVIKTQLKIVIFGSLALLFGFMCLSAIEKSTVNEYHLRHLSVSQFDQHPDIPCQNLDVLDSVDNILHWEILNDTLHIYTKRDSVRDEYERYMYIKNLENDNN